MQLDLLGISELHQALTPCPSPKKGEGRQFPYCLGSPSGGFCSAACACECGSEAGHIEV